MSTENSSPNPIAPKVTGYRDLTDDDVEIINACKAKANDLDAFICALETRPATPQRASGQPEAMRAVPLDGSVDQRELAIARTKLQEGFMHLVKAVAQPRSF